MNDMIRKENRGRALGKLRSKSGETIAETLIALLIAALALVILVGAVVTAQNIVDRSRLKFSNYYAQNESLVKMDGDGTSETTLQVSAEGTETFDPISISIMTYENRALNPHVIAYKKKQDS